MKPDPIWQNPWGKTRRTSPGRWLQQTDRLMHALGQRLLLLALLPLYVWRLGLDHGILTLYRMMLGESGFVIARSDRDPDVLIREDSSDAWEFQKVFILQTWRHLASRRDVHVIVDAGARMGYTSLYLAELYPHAFIYALEPEERNFQALLHNTRHYPNIRPIQAAIWNEDGILEPNSSGETPACPLVMQSSRSRVTSVPTITMQTLMKQYRIPHIDILRLDIKGAEAAVFGEPACHAWMGVIRVLGMVLRDEHHGPDQEHPVLKALQPYKFTVRSAGPKLILDFPEASATPELQAVQRRFS